MKEYLNYEGLTLYDLKIKQYSKCKNVTYLLLKNLRDHSKLVPGKFYRITDFVTTTTQTDTRSAGHVFDIIVKADDVNVLNENAFAALHEGDTYFADSKLEAWEIKYCLDNDTDRFEWADDEDGKGVIYYMKDEFNNECPYDFKNIQFKRVCSTDIEEVELEDLDGNTGTFETRVKIVYVSNYNSKFHNTAVTPTNITSDGKPKAEDWLCKALSYNSDFYKAASLSMWKGDSSDNKYMKIGPCFGTRYGNSQWCYACPVLEKKASGGDVWLYTFTENQDDYENPTGDTVDISLNGYSDNVYNNVIEACNTILNDNVFYGNDCYGNKLGVNCYANIFGYDTTYNIIKNLCYDNSFGYGCGSNSFGNRCLSNSFGDYFQHTSFGNNCSNNSFGEDCGCNTFGNYYYSNFFGNENNYNSFGNNCFNNSFLNACNNNSFGDQCYDNTFGDDCSSNSFGNNCNRNSFGIECYNNSFGNGCYDNTFGDSCEDNLFGNYCQLNTFGVDFEYNSFGNICNNNSFEEDCQNNSFGNSCYLNSFGKDFDGNSFENGCGGNSFGDSCYENSFGNNCQYNSFGNGCCGNSFGNDCNNITFSKDYSYYNIVENGNQHITLTSTQTTAGSALLQNIKIAQGVNNTTTDKTIYHNTVNDNFLTIYQPANSQTVSV